MNTPGLIVAPLTPFTSDLKVDGPALRRQIDYVVADCRAALRAGVEKALPSVVTVKTSSGSGSGFFILDSGIIVTNKHVVGSNQSVSIVTSKGETLQSKSVFVHPTKDLALIKLEGNGFPYIRLADPGSVNVGADVVAIGSPGVFGVTLQNTVTKGIVSSFRKSTEDGIVLQTDVAINSGNSGGPLLNSRGEVVGVNTFKVVGNSIEGLGFSIFVSEILEMLKTHFNYVPEYKKNPTGTDNKTLETKPNKITALITSEPQGAEIYINGKLVGSTPSKIGLTAVEHSIKIVRAGFKDWERQVLVESGSEPSFNAILEKTQP